MKMTQSSIIKSLTSFITACLLTSTVVAQQYLKMGQDELIYDIDVVVFARQLSQPTADSINNQVSVKTPDVVQLPQWDEKQVLLKYPEIIEPPSDSVPIENQADPVTVLSDVILDTSMEHPIIDRLNTNPIYKPIYRQKWRQLPSVFLNPLYVEVSNLKQAETTDDHGLPPGALNQTSINQPDTNLSPFNQPNPRQATFDSYDYNLPATELMDADLVADYAIDGQVAFSEQRFTHLHVKMNLYRINAEGEQIVYELSQQKRIQLDEWQYFDHQQFGVLAKVTAVKLDKGE